MARPTTGSSAGSFDQKLKALETTMGQIEKSHGKGAVMRLGDDVRPPIEVIPTGSIALDVALGIGGLPRGVSSRSTARSPRARPPLRCTPSPMRSAGAASRRSSTPSTPSTPTTPRSSASTRTRSW